ncbi:DNA-binding response regulator [Methylorubrum thiocyanatum]|uniref:winged helix-turn-helix domain-containing protein n=1 Tax=Methylorubrum thiocyanatum TaxID=47958 RepID=UPI00365649E1
MYHHGTIEYRLGGSRISDQRYHLGHVLVAGDDPHHRDMIVDCFRAQDCAVRGSLVKDVLRQLQQAQFSLIVLDVRAAPSRSFDILRQIRARCGIPVILVTGQHQSDADRIVGLELGADDFVGEPLNPGELLARGRAILRRQEVAREASAGRLRGGYRFDVWELRQPGKVLRSRTGRRISLTVREHALLVAFLDAPRRPLSRAYLLQATGAPEDIYDRSVDVQVLRLRRKIEFNASSPKLIRTERDTGYVLDTVVERLFSL